VWRKDQLMKEEFEEFVNGGERGRGKEKGGQVDRKQ
jgi:hypothetical protein